MKNSKKLRRKPKELYGFSPDHFKRIEDEIKGKDPDITDSELDGFIERAGRMELDPILGQIHWCVKHYKDQKTKEKKIFKYIKVGINGYRLSGQREKDCMGISTATFEEEKGTEFPVSCTIVGKKLVSGKHGDHVAEYPVTLYWAEVYPEDDEELSKQWRRSPKMRFAVATESGVWRRMYTEKMGNTYAREEMDRPFSSESNGKSQANSDLKFLFRKYKIGIPDQKKLLDAIPSDSERYRKLRAAKGKVGKAIKLHEKETA